MRQIATYGGPMPHHSTHKRRKHRSVYHAYSHTHKKALERMTFGQLLFTALVTVFFAWLLD